MKSGEGRASLIRMVAVAMVVVTAFWLMTGGGAHRVIWTLSLLPWTVALPLWTWGRRLPAVPRTALVTVLALFLVIMEYATRANGVSIPLFIVLTVISARLPRPVSYIQYAILAILYLSLQLITRSSWQTALMFFCSFFAAIVLTESFVRLKDAYEDKRKLLDSLIQAQRAMGQSGCEAHPTDTGSPVSVTPDQAACGDGSSGGVALSHTATSTSAPKLTLRDREVLGLIASGFSNREIATRLFLTEGTVKNRVSLILDKIGARDRTQAALRARDLHLL